MSADGLRVRRVSAVPEGDVAIDRTIYAEPLDAARFADVQRAVREGGGGGREEVCGMHVRCASILCEEKLHRGRASARGDVSRR